MLTMLLRWNDEHPPSQRESLRNIEVGRLQGNLNPFVDPPDQAQRLISRLFRDLPIS